MPVPINIGNRGGRGEVEWYFTAETREEEQDLLDEDEEFRDDDGDKEGEDEDEEEEGEDDGEEEGDEERVEQEEVDGLWTEAYGEDEARWRRDEVVGDPEIQPSEEEEEEESPADFSRETPIATTEQRHLLHKSSWDAKTKVSDEECCVSQCSSNRRSGH